ncbi:MAG: TfoX/Sxy family protein [Candidatus Eisenbacteria bacterium]|nr:TfoX/Sxy family protein [Candidatus Eisenbacteria bacterium]
MSVSPDFRDYILEQLNRLTPTTARAMFGGAGLYAGGQIFGLLDDDTLYFKTNADTRADFEAVGSRPFQPFGPETKPMGYFEVPADAIEDPEKLRPWLDRALAASIKAGSRKSPKAEREAASSSRKHGTLSVSETITITVPLPRLFDAWTSTAARRLWLHVPSVTTRRANPRKSIRLNWNDGSSSALAEFTTLAGGRCVITVEHGGIQRPAQAAEIAAIWTASLKRLKTRLER